VGGEGLMGLWWRTCGKGAFEFEMKRIGVMDGETRKH